MSPDYNKETKEADYAILELVPEIRLNPAFAMPACFPKHPPVPNMMATVTGWGKTSGKCMHTAYQDDTVNFCLTNATSSLSQSKSSIGFLQYSWAVKDDLLFDELNSANLNLPCLYYEIGLRLRRLRINKGDDGDDKAKEKLERLEHTSQDPSQIDQPSSWGSQKRLPKLREKLLGLKRIKVSQITQFA